MGSATIFMLLVLLATSCMAQAQPPTATPTVSPTASPTPVVAPPTPSPSPAPAVPTPSPSPSPSLAPTSLSPAPGPTADLPPSGTFADGRVNRAIILGTAVVGSFLAVAMM